jgi:hypothetical protein
VRRVVKATNEQNGTCGEDDVSSTKILTTLLVPVITGNYHPYFIYH